MDIDKESVFSIYDKYHDCFTAIATRTAPENEVQYISVVAHCLALYLYDCNDIDEKELTIVAKVLWNKIRIEVGGTMENFTTCVFRELCFRIYMAHHDIQKYAALNQEIDFWRKWIMS